MITVKNTIGRLIEIRQTGHITLDELAESAPVFQKILDSRPGTFVLATDWRGMRVLTPQVSEILLGIMRAENTRAERNAVVIDANAIIGLQIERMFREGGGHSRAVFRDAQKASDWMAEVLGVAERARLRLFLGLP